MKSQRDLGLAIPVNFISSPAVSLSAACFPFNSFEDADYGVCFSNLLAIGFRRFSLDLYWDQGRELWSFCPVSIPGATSVSASFQEIQTSLNVASSFAAASSTSIGDLFLQRQQGNEDLTRSSTTSSPSIRTSATSTTVAPKGTTSLGELQPGIAPYTGNPNASLVSIASYTCTTSIDLSTLITQLRDYFSQTDDTINASLLYISINIHAAIPLDTSLSNPLTTAPRSEYALIGDIFHQNISDYIYTPGELAANRRDVNGTWLTVAERYRPADEFYNVTLNEFDQASTDDGWPSESYVELSRRKRVLLSWGNIDSQVSGYNFTGDSGTIFPENFIQESVSVTASPTGEVTEGCFLRPNTDDIQVAAVNSSWAISSIPNFPYPTFTGSDIAPLLNLTSNVISCGVSPLLNHTLLNVTAGQDYRPYQAFTYAAIWSWASSEPQNYSSPNYRCALTSTTRSGRWIVADCGENHYAACRASRQPYNWTTSPHTVSYHSADDACPKDFEFAAPRTALENSFLTQAMRAANHVDTWVGFNAIDRPNCWVMGGPDAECPYKKAVWDQDYYKKRVILVR
jgi:hypothetical protein